MDKVDKYINYTQQLWTQLMKKQRLPQTPCINCGIMVSLTSEDSVDTTLVAWQKIITEEYLTTYADLRLHHHVNTTHRRMCLTCISQV